MYVDEPRPGRDDEALRYPFGKNERRLMWKKIRQPQGFQMILLRLKWVGVGSQLADQMRRNDPAHAEQSGQKQALSKQLPARHIAAPIGGGASGERRPPPDKFKV